MRLFEPAEARCILEGLQMHYMPRHDRWLNIAELELGVLAGQCLDRRIPYWEILEQESGAWQNQRNRQGFWMNWRFTTEAARIKLKSLYPLSHM